jgi:hypothetical protein
MSKITELAAGRLVDSADLLIILTEPDGMPASVIIHWPSRPTTIDPARFRDAADTMVRLFSEAHVTLTRVRGRL